MAEVPWNPVWIGMNYIPADLMGSSFPKAVAACPIKVRGKIAGILYADFNHDFVEKPDLPNLLFLASRSAGFAIDLLPLKPKAAQAVPVATPQTVAPPPVPVVEPQPPPLPLPDIAAPVAPVTEDVEVVEAVEEQDESEGTVIMPAPALPPVISQEDQKLHDDAKRFARLLVSEIKLYNEAQVAAGREHKDLYERLREDIERSRKMYQDRVPTNIHSSTNYFYEELVRTLANGDPTLLGM